MKIQVLMSTINMKSLADLPIGLHELRKYNVKCTVINQLPGSKFNYFSNQNNLQIYSFSETGISKSRNRNLLKLNEKIGLITDQDIRFKNGFQDIIIEAFEQTPKADIITFQIEDEKGRPFKKYKNKPFWMNQRDIMKVSSVEIAFRTSSIIENNIKFDEDFGLGSMYPTGEEAIFLSDALHKGLKIKYIPKPIVIHPKGSSGHLFKNNEKLIAAKGAMLYRIFGINAYAVSIIFALKKYRKSSETILNFVRLMFKGISSFKKLHDK